MPKALKAIELMGNLASHNYESSPEEQEAMIGKMLHQVDLVASEFGLVRKAPTPEPEPEQNRSLRLIQIGPCLGAAIEALQDNKPDEAYTLLLELMKS